MNRHDPRHALVRRAMVLDADNLTQRVVSGASFTFLGIALRTLITVGSMAILARLLTPADFGYLAMATVVTEFAAMLGSFGLTNILIQRRRVTRLQLDTIFWAAFGTGCALALLVFGLSFVAGRLFGDAIIGSLLRLLCLNFVISALGTVSEALLARLMRFRAIFVIQVTAIALRSTVAMICAWQGLEVWSLVAGSLTGPIVTVVLLSAVAGYVPRWRFSMSYLRFTLKTCGGYLGNTVLFYLCMNIDLFLIGKQLGANALGYYQTSRSLTDEVRGRLAWPLQRVLFPALSSLQNDLSRLRHSVLKATRLLAALLCPIGFGIAAAAPEIVPVLYGEKWLPMIPILTMLGINIAARASTALAPPLFYSQNKVTLIFRYNVIETMLLVTSVVIALPYGLEAIATAIAANSLFSVIIFWFAFRLIGLGFSDVLHVLSCPLFASITMWIAISLLRKVVPVEDVNIVLRLIMTIAYGAIVYCTVLVMMSRQYWHAFVELFRQVGRRK
ncbi:MAG: lipopolysaccharide biosynthesis protein [Azoarcus sp.]|jgi:PST family polysaccharide transporter|nr:lipopolysaccharide biosynthesis protein [Azoarcus sp.]